MCDSDALCVLELQRLGAMRAFEEKRSNLSAKGYNLFMLVEDKQAGRLFAFMYFSDKGCSGYIYISFPKESAQNKMVLSALEALGVPTQVRVEILKLDPPVIADNN